MSDQPNRRDFLKSLGTVGATGVAAAAAGVDASAESQAAAAAAAPATSAPVSHAYTFLTPPEAAFIEAAVDRFIPADDLTPSGTECGVATFIDRQLAGAWGSGDRLYMQGPWQKGTPTQGYQSPMTPAEFLRAGIAATNAYCRKTFQREFDRLSIDQQIKLLQDLEQGRVGARRHPGAGILQPAARRHHAGVLRRPGLRRQSRQGRVEDDRLPGRHRDLLRAHQDVPEQALRRRAEEHRRSFMRTPWPHV